jgi:hypothetical protein
MSQRGILRRHRDRRELGRSRINDDRVGPSCRCGIWELPKTIRCPYHPQPGKHPWP